MRSLPHPITDSVVSIAKSEKFQAMIQIKADNECWLWTGRVDLKGYGAFHCEGKSYRAHRIMLATRAMPPCRAAMACHTCDNPTCVNPGHLYWGDAKSNMDDAVARKRHRIRHKLDRDKAAQIREQFGAGECTRRLAIKFGVSIDAIQLVLKGGSWNSETSPSDPSPEKPSGPVMCKYLGGRCGNHAVAEVDSVIHRGWVPICETHKSGYIKARRGRPAILRDLQPL